MVVLFLCCVLGLTFKSANAAQASSCRLNPPSLQVSRPNILSDLQEQWLGNDMADMVEPRYLILPAEQGEYLTRIGDLLLAQLPPTRIHYTFRIFESGDLRTFSLTSGHIYVSRKLVLEARSEDEIAGMIAQEIGRVYSHHAASLITLRLREMLGVRELGDQADVGDKFQRLLNMPIPESARFSESDEENDEVLADRIAIYALIKAGYDPEAFVKFLDRINLNGGNTGNFLTDLLEQTPEISVRIRKAQKAIASLPSACRARRSPYRPGFKPFQNFLTRQKVNPIVAATPGAKYMQLDPEMSPAIENVRISPDGKYILAQDEFRVHILSASPLEYLFSIDAPGAELAQFSPDSANINFLYSSLRIENWNIASRQPNGILDFADYVGCLQSSLSPDGYSLACFSLNYNSNSVWFRLIDLRTGQLIYQNMDFYTPNFEFQPEQLANRYLNEARQAAVGWSQDGRYFLASSGTAALAFDLQHQKVVKLGNTLSEIYEGRFAFVDSDKLLFDCDWGIKYNGSRDRFNMCYSSFPDGRAIESFDMGHAWLAPITRGPSVLTGPSEHAAASLFDPMTRATLQSLPLEAVDRNGETIAAESPGGGLSVGKLGGTMENVALPITPLASLEAANFSTDGRYLVISDRARGAEWDLTTGKQVKVTPPFRYANFDANDELQVRFEDHELKPSSNLAIDRRTHKFVTIPSIAAQRVQRGSVLVDFKPLESDELTTRNVLMEGFDAATGAKLWARRFPSDSPALVPTSDGDHFLLIMDRRSICGGDEVSHNKKVTIRTSDEIHEFTERGLVIEVVSSRTGAAERVVVAPELPSARFGDERNADLFGGLLAVSGSHNNTVVYRLSDGARLFAGFGRALAADSGSGLIALANRQQEVHVFDIGSGKQLLSVVLDHNPLAAHFLSGQRRLLVLTATQRVYGLDIPVPSEVPRNENEPAR